jgi:hypothetical protein
LIVLFGFMPLLNWGTSWFSSRTLSFASNSCIRDRIVGRVGKCSYSFVFWCIYSITFWTWIKTLNFLSFWKASITLYQSSLYYFGKWNLFQIPRWSVIANTFVVIWNLLPITMDAVPLVLAHFANFLSLECVIACKSFDNLFHHYIVGIMLACGLMTCFNAICSLCL